MKIAVLGSGVIGVTSAYYLAKAGHEVTVIDRQFGPAQETSFANAGEISRFLAAANPNLPEDAVRGMLLAHGAHAESRHAYSGRTLREEALVYGNEAMADVFENKLAASHQAMVLPIDIPIVAIRWVSTSGRVCR